MDAIRELLTLGADPRKTSESRTSVIDHIRFDNPRKQEVKQGEGVLELRLHHGAGFRDHFGRHGSTIVILLCGGTKRSQVGDIALAKEYWADWKRRQG